MISGLKILLINSQGLFVLFNGPKNQPHFTIQISCCNPQPGISRKYFYSLLDYSQTLIILLLPPEKRDDFIQHFKAFSVGAEFYLSKVFALRFGYDNEKRSELKVGTTSGIAGFNAGLGINISSYRFDYAYSSMGKIGALHRISLVTAF